MFFSLGTVRLLPLRTTPAGFDMFLLLRCQSTFRQLSRPGDSPHAIISSPHFTDTRFCQPGERVVDQDSISYGPAAMLHLTGFDCIDRYQVLNSSSDTIIVIQKRDFVLRGYFFVALRRKYAVIGLARGMLVQAATPTILKHSVS